MDEKDPRAAAIERLEAKRDFRTHVAAYVIVNALLVGIWAATGASYFWPIWSILGWGVGLAFHGWDTYRRKGFTEEEIRDEMDKGG